MRVPAAKITGQDSPSGIPPDHLRGHGLKELAFRAVRQETKVFEGCGDLTLRPLLGPGDGIGGEYRLYACLEQARGWARVREDTPYRVGVPLLQGEDDR